MTDNIHGTSGVRAILPLFRELNDLKRIRQADRQGSIAERIFLRSWARLCRGEELRQVALNESAHAVSAARLAGIDTLVLQDAGLSADERLRALQAGFDAVAAPLGDELQRELRAALSPEPVEDMDGLPEDAPDFAYRLSMQPRAGATRPGQPRVALEPTENHAEHCAIVAVYGVLSAPLYGAQPELAFLTGLAHHLHNARLPDAGDAGDALLGELLKPIMERFRDEAIAELPDVLQAPTRESLDSVFRSDTPESQAFQTADSCDRVLEMDWHAHSAAFTLDVALQEMDIIHPGPVQAFQLQIMRDAGLMQQELT